MSGYGSMGGEEQQGMDKMKDDLAQKTGDVVDQAREQTEQAVDKVRGSAFQAMDQQKHRAADSLGSVAQALRQTGDSLHNSDQVAIGQYAQRAADAVDQFSSQLHDKSVEELLSDAEQFARREPELFLGGAVLLGLLASRFLKASSRRSQMQRGNDYDEYGYQGQYDRSYGQRQYGRTGMGSGGYDRRTWGSEGIDYRSAGTGGYRTTISSSANTGPYGEMDTDATSGDMSLGHEHAATERRPRRSSTSTDMSSDYDDASLRHDEEGTGGFNAGNSQA